MVIYVHDVFVATDSPLFTISQMLDFGWVYQGQLALYWSGRSLEA